MSPYRPPRVTPQIMSAAHNLHEAFQEWSPVIDGVELTDDPRKLMAAGASESGGLEGAVWVKVSRRRRYT